MISIILKGKVRIEVLVNGKVDRVYSKDNVVTNRTLLDLVEASGDLSMPFAGTKISISRSETNPTYSVFNLTFIATGYIPSGVTSPDFIDTINPVVGEIINDIDFTGQARNNIWTVGLTTLSSNSNHAANTTSNAFAYTKLDNAITQGEAEVLRIYYQIQFPYTGYGIKPWIQKELAKYLFGKLSTSHPFKWCYVSGIGASEVDWECMTENGRNCVLSRDRSNWQSSGTYTQAVITSHFKRKYQITFNRFDTNTLGYVFNALFFGRSAENPIVGNFRKIYSHEGSRYSKYTKEPYQMGFWHNANAQIPFFNTTEAGVSGGNVVFSGNWDKKIPQFYEIIIGNSGAVGTATYRFRKKLHTGVWGNNFISRLFDIPWRASYEIPKANIHGWQDKDVTIYGWKTETKIVQYDENGITILDLWDGEHITYDSTSIPSFTAIDITQIAPDPNNNKIYVGCKQTGIWIIDTQANSVSNPITTPCYGIDLGRDGEVWALITGRLTNLSTSWTTAFSITYEGLTNGNWDKCRFLKCDRSTNTDRLAIVVNTGGENSRIIWWDKTNQIVNQGVISSQLLVPMSLGWCAEDASFWCCSINTTLHRLTYGSSSSTSLGITAIGYSNSNPATYSGRTLINFYKNGVIGQEEIKDASNNRVELIVSNTVTTILGNNTSNIQLGNLRHFFHLSNGVCLLKYTTEASIMQQILSGYERGWLSYGWDSNSNQWVEGQTGFKTTHVNAEALSDSISIAFANGEIPSISFIANEKLHRSVNWGVLKSNANTVGITWGWYSKGLVKEVDYTATIPSSSPYTLTLPAKLQTDYITAEVDSPEVHEFSINNIPIANLNVNGIPPAINEITLDGITGVMTFNAADAGKTVTGIYYWLSN